MCGSMVDIQSAAAEIRLRLGEEKKKEEEEQTTAQKYHGPLLHRAAITRENLSMCEVYL